MSSVIDLLEKCKVVPKEGDKTELLPNGAVIFYSDGSHRYWALDLDENGKGVKTPLSAVSSVLGVLNKPALMDWSWRLGMQGQDYRTVRDDASTRGTSVHDAAEHLAKDGTRPKLSDFPEEDRGYVQALASFWLTYRPKTIATEVIVASLEYGYAGRFDLLALIDGKRVLADFKTSKRVYPIENFCQLEAYELASTECGYPETDERWIVRLGEDGSFEVAVSCATPNDFLGVLEAFRATKRVEKTYKAAMKAAEKELEAA